MAFRAETSDLPATAVELRALSALGLARVARLFDVDERSARRWRDGTRHLPRGAAIVLRLLVDEVITVAQLEQAARTNGSVKPKSAPRRVASAPESPALADAEAPLDDPGPSTAEKVFALAPRTCRWPCGTPGDHGFRFCGDPVATRPYCERHRVAAYLSPPPTRPRQASAGGWKPSNLIARSRPRA
jgi:hypothetical protein